MEALAAFSYLDENVPTWNTRVAELQAHTAAKRQEYIEDFKKHGTVRVRRRKNSSVCSIHTDNDKPGAGLTKGADEAVVDDDDDPDEQQQQQQQPTARDLPSRVPRKRGLRTDDSSSISTEQTWVSTRHNLIIHYDGHTQKALEEIVRDVGVARSYIRRGKMSHLPLTGMRPGGGILSKMRTANASSALLSKAMELGEEDEDDDDAGVARSKPTKVPDFETADKLLEVAHSLCESAAYQFLRVGDCSVELGGVQDNFKSIMGLASSETERLKEIVQEKEGPAEDGPSMTAASGTRPGEPDEMNKGQTTSGAIEVDDESSDASAEAVDITAFRANRKRF